MVNEAGPSPEQCHTERLMIRIAMRRVNFCWTTEMSVAIRNATERAVATRKSQTGNGVRRTTRSPLAGRGIFVTKKPWPNTGQANEMSTPNPTGTVERS